MRITNIELKQLYDAVDKFWFMYVKNKNNDYALIIPGIRSDLAKKLKKYNCLQGSFFDVKSELELDINDVACKLYYDALTLFDNNNNLRIVFQKKYMKLKNEQLTLECVYE
jgi:hypothetical protein